MLILYSNKYLINNINNSMFESSEVKKKNSYVQL